QPYRRDVDIAADINPVGAGGWESPGLGQSKAGIGTRYQPACSHARYHMLLAGKKVVVVGGSSGIGLATAEMAKREGADVIVASRNVERLDKAAEKLNAISIPADVTSDDSVGALYGRCAPGEHVV